MKTTKRQQKVSSLLLYTEQFYRNIIEEKAIYSLENQYTNEHPNATTMAGASDDPKNIKGKGTGKFLDTENGGGFIDVNGDPTVPNSGYRGQIGLNTWTPDKQYDPYEIRDLNR